MTPSGYLHLSMEETQRRLPGVTRILDDEIRTEVMYLASQSPAYFWEVPASTSGFHHPLCRGKHGLWAHTLMSFTAVERLVDSYEARFDVEPDHARAAILLHDMRKNGDPEYPSKESVGHHDLYMAKVIRDQSDLPEVVAEAVESHMGPWYDGPEPSEPLEELVHNADMMASTATATLSVPGPVPEELAEVGVKEGDL